MDIKEYIHTELELTDTWRNMALQGLNEQELCWRPACGCNSIGLILYHMVRMEDSYIQARMQGKEETWHTGKWYKKLKIEKSDIGEKYTVEQVNTFKVPPVGDLLQYYQAVRAATLAYLEKATPEDFDKKTTIERFGEVTVGFIFAGIIGHTFEHIGEIFYLRGLQRGMDK